MNRRHEGERSKLYWIPSLMFVFILLLSIVGLTFLIEDQFHRAGFITAAIMASIGFHLFSLGNTAYACAASLENEELTEYGYRINQNGIYATFGAGGVFLASALWFLLQEIDNPGERFRDFYWVGLSDLANMIAEQPYFTALRVIISTGLLIFAIGFLNQSRYGNWFTVILEEIDASPDDTTIVDTIVARITAVLGRSTEDSLTEHTITIKDVDPPEFHVVKIDAPEEIEAGEEYEIETTIENRGSQQGTCKVVYQYDGEVADSVERTLSGGGETTVEFRDTAPESQYERTIRIEAEEING